ncbi:hypothetical protein Tco_1392463 [Tanacetum coccineum]
MLCLLWIGMRSGVGVDTAYPRSVGEPPAVADNASIKRDEIQNFIDGLYIFPRKACWRILKYEIHSRQTDVQILAVHLENMQSQRRSAGSIGRLANVHPSFREIIYLRLLLCHQIGCRTFEDIRTVNRRLYPTFRAACEALGLLGDDKEWHIALEEASFSSTGHELRTLFAHILIFCDVPGPINYVKLIGKRCPKTFQ